MDPQLQKVSSQLHRPRTLWASLCFHVGVVVQLCSSDGVEDLLESLAIDSPKSLTYQEPEGHHRVGPAADHLQGDLMSPLRLFFCLPSVFPLFSLCLLPPLILSPVSCLSHLLSLYLPSVSFMSHLSPLLSHMSPLRSGLGPGFGSSSDSAAGVLSG